VILVDTSVLIGYLKGRTGEKFALFDKVLASDMPFGVAPYTVQELLQGARDKKEFDKLREYLSTQTVYYLSAGIAGHIDAAQIFFNLRRAGVTVRSTIDMLIAVIAIEHNLYLLHNDRDFDVIARGESRLRILESL
jgi:predicted nucleic acid-binding protein